MKRRLATIAAALAVACFINTNASALSLTDPGVLGTIVPGVPFGNGFVDNYVNYLLDLGLGQANVYDPVTNQRYTRNTVLDPGTGQVTETDHLDGTGTSVEAGWEYLVAKYDGPNGGAIVYYLGYNPLTLPATSQPLWLTPCTPKPNKPCDPNRNGLGLSGWVAYNAEPVPDSGSTAVLLGSAFLAFGVLRRKLNKA